MTSHNAITAGFYGTYDRRRYRVAAGVVKGDYALMADAAAEASSEDYLAES